MNGAIVGVAIVIVVVMLAVVLKMGKGVSGQKREEIHRDLDAVRSLSQ